MEKKLNELIEEYRNGDNNQFLLIIDKFQPNILKYTRLLYKDEREDTISEFSLSLLEAVNKIEYYSDEGQCFKFLSNALKNRYLELYRKSRKRFDHEQQLDDDYHDYCFVCQEYNDIELIEDLKNYLLGYNEKQIKILISIFIEGKSNTVTATENNVSRQYTNRIKNKICKKIKDDYIA